MDFSDAELLRYSRQIFLDDIDLAGQQRLREATVLVVGLGGLGSPAALYLAAAGVGRLLLADGDALELSNLQRQILYRSTQLGRRKAMAARDTLRALNPEIRIEASAEHLSARSLDRSVARADVVLDCTDRQTSRQAINRACLDHRRLLIAGAALHLQGQLIHLDLRAPDSPCLQCLFPDSGDPAAPGCQQAGILGPVLGIIGSSQALSALQVILGLPCPTTNRLVSYDARTLRWRTVTLAKDPRCPACGSAGDRAEPAAGPGASDHPPGDAAGPSARRQPRSSSGTKSRRVGPV